jgi:PAS domain S-box-containing protein
MRTKIKRLLPKLGIQGKLNLLFILLSTIPLSLISIYFIQKQIENQQENTLRTVKNEVNDIKTKTTLLLSRVKQEMIMLSNTSEVKLLINNQSRANQKDFVYDSTFGNHFIELLKDNELYFRVELLNKNGRKVVSAYLNDSSFVVVPKEKLPKTPMHFYVNAVRDMKKGEVKLSPSEIKVPSTGQILPAIDCMIPIYDDSHNLEAILTTSIKAEYFFKSFTLNRLDTTVKVIMVNGEGFYLYHSQKKNSWNRLLAERQEQNLYTDYRKSVCDSLLHGLEGTITEDPDRIIEYASIFSGSESKANSYIVFTEIPTSIAYANVKSLRILFLVLFIAVIGLSVLAAFVTARNYIRPINQLIQGTRIIRDGNLDYELDVESNDEIQDLVVSFNQLVVHWKDKRELEEKQRLEKDIKERKQYLETIMDSSLDLLITINEKGKFSFANKRLEDLLGYHFSDIKDKDFNILFPDNLHSYMNEQWDEIKNKSGIVYETQIIKADGSLMDCIISQSQLKGLNEYLAIVKDITERKRAEELIRASEVRYRRLFEASKDGIMILDAGTCIIEDVNPYLTEMVGYKYDDFIGKKLDDLAIFSKISCNFNKINELEAKNFIKVEDFLIDTMYGNKIFVEFVASKYNSNNRNVIQCNIRNITERKQAEEAIIHAKEKAEIASRLKSNFLGNMSHELRTPMIGIQGFSKILKESNDINDSKEIGAYIAESSNRLMDTLNLIIDISRIESGDWNLNIYPMDLIEQIMYIVNRFKDLAAEKNLTIDFIAEHNSYDVNSDQHTIESILHNIVDNAVKFTSSGGVTINFSTEIENNIEYAIIKVVDTGIGIPDEKIDFIFEEFRQVSEGLVRNYDGVGLGLTLTKKFVVMLGGTIEVTSKLNEGSCFTVRLPLERSIYLSEL